MKTNNQRKYDKETQEKTKKSDSIEELREIIKNQNETIEELLQRMSVVENTMGIKDQEFPPIRNSGWNYNMNKDREYKPAERIDMQGNQARNDTDEIVVEKTPQPIDYATVVTTRKHLKPRPELSNSINEEVKRDLEEFRREKEKTNSQRKARGSNEQFEKK